MIFEENTRCVYRNGSVSFHVVLTNRFSSCVVMLLFKYFSSKLSSCGHYSLKSKVHIFDLIIHFWGGHLGLISRRIQVWHALAAIGVQS